MVRRHCGPLCSKLVAAVSGSICIAVVRVSVFHSTNSHHLSRVQQAFFRVYDTTRLRLGLGLNLTRALVWTFRVRVRTFRGRARTVRGRITTVNPILTLNPVFFSNMPSTAAPTTPLGSTKNVKKKFDIALFHMKTIHNPA